MIIHHEQAIEMSQFAATNAKRQEIKELAVRSLLLRRWRLSK